jgi:prepilin-type N-terminal cleavage/methylation domain-containing protein
MDFTITTPNSRGFTLIETVITLVVLSLAAVGVLSVYTSGMKGSVNPLLISQATMLAQGEMDKVFGERAANGFGAGTLATGNPPCQSTMTLDSNFTCNRTIYFVDPAVDLNTPSAATDYKHVTVTITQPIIGTVVVDSLITNY